MIEIVWTENKESINITHKYYPMFGYHGTRDCQARYIHINGREFIGQYFQNLLERKQELNQNQQQQR